MAITLKNFVTLPLIIQLVGLSLTPILVSAESYRDGTLLRAKDDVRVYVVFRDKKRWVKNIEVFNSYGYKWQDVRVVDPSYINALPINNLVRAKDDIKVYALNDNGFKRHIPSPEVFLSYGFDWKDIAQVTTQELANYGESLLIREVNNPMVFFLEDGKKHWVSSIESFYTHNFSWEEIHVVNSKDVEYYTASPAITPESTVQRTTSIVPIATSTTPIAETPKLTATSTTPIAETTPAPSGGGGGGAPAPAPAPTPAPAPAPTPAPAPVCARASNIASGSQTYSVSSGSGQPQIQGVTIDPLKIQAGVSQTISITARDTNGKPITSMSATITTDSGSNTVSLALNSGTATSGSWQGSWTVAAAPCAVYEIKATATSASGTSNVTLAFL